jgi:MFS family permease
MTASDERTLRSRWRGAHTVLALCIGAYFAVRFTQVVVGAVVPSVLETFTVSRSAMGLVLTGMWGTYALSQLPSGVLADRVGERTVILLALGVAAASSVAVAVSPTFLLFGLGVLVLGVGAGLYYNPATTLIAREFDGIGRTIGAHRLGGQVAGAVSPVVVAVVTVRYDWRAAAAVGAGFAVVVGLAFLRQVGANRPTAGSVSGAESVDLETAVALLRRSRVRYTTAMMAVVEFVGMASMAFLPAFLVQYGGLSIGRANLLFAVFFTVSAVTQPVGGWLSDRVGRDGAVLVQTVAGVVGYATLAVGAGSLALPAVVLTGVTTSSTPVLQSRLMDGFAEGDRGAAFGLFRTLYLLVGSLGTTVVGAMADVAGWGVAFGALGALLGGLALSLPLYGTVRGGD